MPITPALKVQNCCCHCMKTTNDIKVCVGCRMVRYCSAGCQKAAWKAHKPTCGNPSKFANPIEPIPDAAKHAEHRPSSSTKDGPLAQWTTYWQPTIFVWGAWLMDLPHHPKNRLQTHVFMLRLLRRGGKGGNYPSPNRFILNGGGIMTRQEVVEIMKQADPGGVDEWENDRRGENCLQIVVLDDTKYTHYCLKCPPRERLSIIRAPFLHMDVLRKPLPYNIPDIMGALGEDWVNVLSAVIDSGDPARSNVHFVNTLRTTVDNIDSEALKSLTTTSYQVDNLLLRFLLTKHELEGL